MNVGDRIIYLDENDGTSRWAGLVVRPAVESGPQFADVVFFTVPGSRIDADSKGVCFVAGAEQTGQNGQPMDRGTFALL